MHTLASNLWCSLCFQGIPFKNIFICWISFACCAFVRICFLVPRDRLLGADLLAPVCDVWLWGCHFPIGILGQVWCLILSIRDLCPLSNFEFRPDFHSKKIMLWYLGDYCLQMLHLVWYIIGITYITDSRKHSL